MEKARSYWPTTIGTRRFGEMPFLGAVGRSSSLDESWEERAFAKDSAGHPGGGCVWPPRSYSCSFCRREFRSAQALGGHMNVHRKDRAMLRQCSSPGAAAGNQPLECIAHLMTSPARELQYGGGKTANPNPNSASSLPPRVSAAIPSQERWGSQSSASRICTSSMVGEKLKDYSIVSAAAAARPTATTTLQLFALPATDLNRTSRSLQRTGGDYLGTRETEFQGGEDEGDENRSYSKRRRIETEGRRSVQDDRKEASPEEELDLELRLGDISQVK